MSRRPHSFFPFPCLRTGIVSARRITKRKMNGNRLQGDERGQMHVLEVMIGGLLILSAIQVGVNVAQYPAQEDSGTEELRTLGNDALRTLYHLPPSGEGFDPAGYGNSTLVYSVVENNSGIITAFLNSTLPTHVSYSFTVEHYSTEGGAVSSEGIILFHGPDVLGETARTHFIFQHDGDIYDAQLLMWYLSREAGA